jgi:hypothetical protein
MIAPVMVSVLHPAARTKAGKSLSHEVTGQSPISPDLVTTEGWSPILYSKPRRAQVNFLEARCIGFDVDEKMTLDEAVALVKARGLAHIIGTTTHHQKPKGDEPACDRFRVILFLSEPIFSPEQYKASLDAIANYLEIPVDKQAKDAARWFIPCTEVVSTDLEGVLVAPVTAVTPPPVPKTAPASASGARGKLAKATRDFLAQEPSSEGWHTRFIKAAIDMKEQGYSIDEAAQRLTSASPVFELDGTDMAQLADVYENRGGALPLRPAWPDMLPGGKNHEPRPDPNSTANQRHLLTEVLGFTFENNSRRQVVYYTERGSQERLLLSDTTLARLNTAAREHKIAAGESLRDLIITIAQEHAFDPILDPLDALVWDGKDHIAKLFDTITLPTDTTPESRAWYSLFLKRWLIGVVTKVYSPGAENNVLVFQGEQAAGKSRWLKRLAELWPDGFGEGSISPDDKDHELRHLDNFIWHVAEFDSTTSRREVGALKDYFTKDTVSVRRPYSRLPITGRSICSFCASVNSHDFLHDATGNRRYLVIPVVSINADHAVSIPQVFAQAKALMQAGERQWFSKDEILEVNRLNAHFLSKEEYLEEIEARVHPGLDSITVKTLMEELGFDDVQLTRPIRSNIRTVLERNGVKKQTRGGATQYLVDKARLRGKLPQAPDLLVLKKGQ